MAVRSPHEIQTYRYLRQRELELRRGNKGLASKPPLPLIVPVLWTPLEPRPGLVQSPQADAYSHAADILYFGGSAGGGKTDLLLGLAGTHHRKSIIFRREFPQLAEILDRARQIYQAYGQYNGMSHTWQFRDVRSVEFGAVQIERFMQKYQGRPHDLVAFDEVASFLESQFRFLIAWLRTTVEGQRCRVVATGNPPTTAEGEWIIQYWGPWLDPTHPHPAVPGELRWYATIDDQDVEREDGQPFTYKGEIIQPMSRTFIPSNVEDNPYLMRTGYKTVPPEFTRAAPLETLARGFFGWGWKTIPGKSFPQHGLMKRWIAGSTNVRRSH